MSTSEVCYTLPPVVTEGYTVKGTYETIAGLKTYITGSTSAKIGIIDAYDIFGLSNQTLQGADLLASSLDAVLLIPDFFKGESVKKEWMSLPPEEKKPLWDTFMAESASIPAAAEALVKVVQESKTKFPSVAKWGAYGLCWGAKVVVLSSGQDTPFAASGQVHPSRLEASDAVALTIPHIVLASKDESTELISEYSKAIQSNNIGGHVETYGTMWHGWMGARANLEEEHSRAEYIRGYTKLVDFFGKYLK